MSDRSHPSLREFIDRLLEDSKVRSAPTFPVDVLDAGDSIVVTVSLPGADQRSLNIHYERQVLTIRATLKTACPDQAQTLLRERFSGELRRSLRLPVAIEMGRAIAEYVDGVLTLTLPKTAAAGPHRIHLN